MMRPVTVFWCLAFCLLFSPCITQAAPRTKVPKGAAEAKAVDLQKASDDKLIDVQIVATSATSGTLTLFNKSQDPLNVKVPLALAAIPVPAPQGAGQQYYLTAYGTAGAPPAMAIAVNPLGSSGVEKKAGTRKTNIKPIKKAKPADDAKDEKKDDDKDAKTDDDKKDEKKTDSVEASVFLLPETSQTLSLTCLGLDNTKLPANYGAFNLAELDKVSQTPELKKVLELMGTGVITRNVAQILAWHYHKRQSWEELAATSLVTLVDLEVAKQYADVVEGKTPAEALPASSKKKKR